MPPHRADYAPASQMRRFPPSPFPFPLVLQDFFRLDGPPFLAPLRARTVLRTPPATTEAVASFQTPLKFSPSCTRNRNPIATVGTMEMACSASAAPTARSLGTP